ncbi:MAG: hypothetical protein M1816_004125, partial [Peltula sp. TS41687]
SNYIILNPRGAADYATLPNLMHAVNEHAKEQGYTVIKERTKRNTKGELCKAYLACDRGGKLEVPKEWGKDCGLLEVLDVWNVHFPLRPY